ncbi:MAG: TIM-barrel domain-containing protein, partial [Endomicrobiia bacterium]
TDWRKHTWNGYEWNKEFFPEPKIFLDELKRQNIHTCLNDHPGYGQSDELPEDDPYREKIKERIPDIKEYRVRWSDERYVYAWVDEIFTKFLKEGIDFWWVDGWGATDGIMDLSSQLWLNKFYFEACKKTGDNRRPIILSRWGGIGSHKYPVQFSGDTYSSFETLKYQISFTHKGGNIGAVYWSHDIGGFLGGKLPEDLYIRWLQFGCFSPILRTHSSGGERDIWNYSEKTLNIFRKYVRIRYALFPYFYTLARECFDTGLPLIRGLYLEYPNDKNAYIYEEEYLIGKDILVAPVYTPDKVCERKIYFPKGIWFSLEDKEIIKGPCVKKLKVPLEKIPVFIKKGAIIPSFSVKENLSQIPSEIEFNIFPDKKTEFIYYEDDGLTEEYLLEKYLTQKISVTESKKEIRVEIHPAVGGYTGCPSEIFYKLNIFIDRKKTECVFINGKKSHFKHTKKLLSGTVDSSFNFLYIEVGRFKRNHKIEVVIPK